MVEGWILDVYPSISGEMIIWVKSRKGNCVKLVDSWKPSIYVASDDVSNIEGLVERKEIQDYIHNWGLEKKMEKITDTEFSNVLRLTVKEAWQIEKLARVIERLAVWGVYRIYNVDVMPAQSYFYEKNLFPLAYVKAEKKNDEIYWKLLDDIQSKDYELPLLKSVRIQITVASGGKIPQFDDPIDTIQLQCDKQNIEISDDTEPNKILDLVEIIRTMDPDIVFTAGGDRFLIPYLVKRVQVNCLSNELVMGREKDPVRLAPNKGRSYVSYGRVLYRHPTYKFLGRIHIDETNTFFHNQCKLDGVVEVARLCRLPIHTAARASIGKALGSLQFYRATKDNILIPWKPILAEHPKTAGQLMFGDRGGFIFEPKMGVYSHLGELDFVSLYPMIMVFKNVSAETVLCKCCPDSSKRVPEVDYNICEKRNGIVPKTLGSVLQKRLDYKKMRDSASSPEEKARYDARQAALKWILVCCYGYLSYRNAKFGRIDAHISVCAFARKILMDAARMVEIRGFNVIHGIVDSLWLQKPGMSVEDYRELCFEIEKETGFPISFEGIYKWVVFLPSRMRSDVPVLNRYFGVFENGEVKMRGIESRRSDTPKFISRCQEEIIGALSDAVDAEDVINKIPSALKVLKHYADLLCRRQVSVDDLMITKRLSKNPEDYKNNIVQSLASKQLRENSLRLEAGQRIQYVISDDSGKSFRRRVVAAQLVDDSTRYDVEKYLKFLIEAAGTVLTPFGYNEERIKNLILNKEIQQTLE